VKTSLKENAEQPKLSSSGQKLNDRLAKIPGLDDLMAKVQKREDAAEILVAMAEKLGGDKFTASKHLNSALAIAKKEEANNNSAAPAAAPAAAPSTPATNGQTITESFRSVKHFVNYLFE